MTCQSCSAPLTGRQEKFCSRKCQLKTGSKDSSISKILAANGIDPSEIGKVEKVKVSEWGRDGEFTATSVVLSPKWAEGPEWPPVQQARPCVIKPIAQLGQRKKGKLKQAVILPDPQVGFRQFSDGTLDPFHDEAAMAAALRIVAQVQPDLIVNLGDLLDLAEFGTYVQEPAFANTTQAAIDRGHRFLIEQKAAAPHSKQVLLEGNHDRRIQSSITANAKAALHITRAGDPEGWPVMSVPHVLRLDELGVEYVPGYPAGRYWINERLACDHAPSKYKSAGSSAAVSIEDERVSVIFGHIHRIELVHKTRPTREGPKQNLLASPGCLCRIDGAVPSAKGSTDPAGRPVLKAENWQNGCCVVTYTDGNGPFSIDLVPIIEGRAIYRGSFV